MAKVQPNHPITKKRKDPHGALRGQLVEGEELLHVAYVHWAIFMHPGLLLFLALMFAIFFHWMVGFAILLMALYPTANALIRFLTTKLVLTNKRVLARYGFFNKDNIQLKLNRIESAHVEEPFVGQIFGYSTVMLNGTGTGVIPITFIANGMAFVKKLEEITLTDNKI